MRLKISESKNSKSLYVIESTYIDGKHSSRVVEKLGTFNELLKMLDGQDPIEWAKEYIKELNIKEKEDKREVIHKYSPTKIIPKNKQRAFNGGYLFLQRIYFQLGLHKICGMISKKYKFKYDLDSILSRLIYGRIIFPSSKLSTYKLSKKLIEQPNFALHHIYRALGVIAKESNLIQSELYKNSLKMSKRNTGILYYDCTNFFFEIEEESGLKQYGVSKEHRPNPIVQMGLFMDGDGIPLSFSITEGNKNEQTTLRPLEQQILTDFELSKFVVCTDAGLASNENRRFNDRNGRAFITTQSIKKLKKHLKKWALNPEGWHLPNIEDQFNLDYLDPEKDYDKIYYKERWINENNLEQRLIVTYSLKYKNYQREIRNNQINRAEKVIKKNPGKLKKANQNDYKRLIAKTNYTQYGELAEEQHLSLDEELIINEERFDGFYGVCTNLEDEISKIIKINQGRWEIEETFRIMKKEFKARPVHLSRDDRIIAHFTTCFIALLVYRLLEKRIDEKYTANEIIYGIREMNFYKIEHEGYSPIYTRNDFTDNLHEVYEFRTDYEIITKKTLKEIIKKTKR